MADTIACPECGRALRVTEELYGQEVRCPSCRATFTAERPLPPMPTYTVREQPAPPRRRDDDVRPERRVGRDDHVQPHRGATVLTLGILSIVLACCFVAGWVLGGIALAMANEDLRKMAAGQMDRAGQGQTQAAKICAILGLVFATGAFCINIGTHFLRRL
jgi:predicted Zn finger-like uncharacterized protein